MLVPSRVGYTRRGIITIFCATEGRGPFAETSMNRIALILTAAAYLLSFGCYVRFLNTGRELIGRLGTLFLALGLVAHYFALLERSRGLHTVPYHDLYGSMSLFGWLLALTYLGLELYHRQRLVGLVSVSIGTALGLVSVDRLMCQYWFYDSKYVVSLFVLLLYALYFRLARTATWRGARASKLCIFNFVVVVLSFTVVNLYLSHSHRYF